MVMRRIYKGKNQNPDHLSFNDRLTIVTEEMSCKPQKPSKIDPEKEWQRVKPTWDTLEAWERYSGFRLPEDHPDRRIA